MSVKRQSNNKPIIKVEKPPFMLMDKLRDLLLFVSKL